MDIEMQAPPLPAAQAPLDPNPSAPAPAPPSPAAAPAPAPAPPAPAHEEEGLIGWVGGAIGIIILLASVVCTIISSFTIYNANKTNEALVSYHGVHDPKTSTEPGNVLLQAYASAAALFILIIMEHVYVYMIIGDAISSLHHDHPRIEGKRSFQHRLPFYWSFIILLVICYIVGIYDMHHTMPSSIPVYSAIILQYVTLAFTMSLRWMAVDIQSTVLARRWLDEFPVLTVRVNDLDQCAVCLDVPQVREVVRRLPCGHIFHRHCIDEWLTHPDSRRACPACNLVVR